MTSVDLRPTSAEDAEIIRLWFAESIRELLAAMPEPMRETALAMQWAAKSASITGRAGVEDRIAMVEGRAVGRLVIAHVLESDVVVDVVVAEAERGHGVGAAMLRQAIDEASAAGRAISLHVRHGNPAAKLYSRLGFVIVGASATDLEMRREPPVTSHAAPSALGSGYVPVRVEGTSARDAIVRFVDVGSARLDDPFFGDAIAAARGSSAGPARGLSLAELLALPVPDDAIPLAGIIFHVSRCGSSLVTRALQADPSTFGVGEHDAIDALLCRLELDDETRVAALRALVRALARRRNEGTRRLVLKLDAWHLARHALLARAFPEVPALVVLRDPVGVIASQRARRGSHFVPGLPPARVLAIDPDAYAPADLDGYGCLVLRALYRHAAAMLARPEVRFVGFASLDRGALVEIARIFGAAPDEAVVEAIDAQRGVHAKDRNARFDPADDALRERALPPDLLARIAADVRPAYDALMRGIAEGERAIASRSDTSAMQSITR